MVDILDIDNLTLCGLKRGGRNTVLGAGQSLMLRCDSSKKTANLVIHIRYLLVTVIYRIEKSCRNSQKPGRDCPCCCVQVDVRPQSKLHITYM